MCSEINLFKAYITSILETIANNENINDVIIKNEGEIEGGGYLGFIHLYNLIGSNKSLPVIVKAANNDKAVRERVPLTASFLSEIFFYDHIVPTFQEFYQSSKIYFDIVPKCYFTSKEKFKEILIFENLKAKGYDVWDKSLPFPSEEVEFVMQLYAKLHASSLAYKMLNPKKYEALEDKFGDNLRNWFIHGKLLSACISNGKKYVNLIKDPIQAQRFVTFLENAESFILNYNQKEDPYSVILHADNWGNNIMFKFEEVNGIKKPTNAKLIDFQLSRCGSIIFDVSNFLMICTDHNILNNMEHYLQIYHTTLIKQMKQLGCNDCDLFSFEKFMSVFNTKCQYGLIMCPLYIKIMLMDSVEAPNINDDEFVISFLKDIKLQNEFEARYKFVLDYYYKNNYY